MTETRPRGRKISWYKEFKLNKNSTYEIQR